MKKAVIGYIYCEKKLQRDEKIFLRLAKKNSIEMVMFNAFDNLDEEEIENEIKRCDIIFNNSAEEIAIELVKTIEELGGKVIDPSKIYYYIEDKWMFFLKCKENKIPTPETILLSESINTAVEQLKSFGKWPVVLKRVSGTRGEYVDKADNPNDARKVIKRFWEKGDDRLPIIAQELIHSPCYRVTVVGEKIVQTAVKNTKDWKATGEHSKTLEEFTIDDELEKIIKKVTKVSGISVCGIDFLKKDGKWVVLEVNAEPGFDFFENQREKLIEETLIFLKGKIKNRR
ncbi:ATP-grasp domain-containing protein [Candidatus Pacearchaeota archaeon]|nr:ATP-grasp domain-containing protein [Candidatus Pacearchaeota archaeon]